MASLRTGATKVTAMPDKPSTPEICDRPVRHGAGETLTGIANSADLLFNRHHTPGRWLITNSGYVLSGCECIHRLPLRWSRRRSLRRNAPTIQSGVAYL